MAGYYILLVDDDPEDRMIISEGLYELGAADRLLFAEHGEAALALLAEVFQGSQLPGLIVLDLNMPRLNGTEVLRMLKEDVRFKQIPVIIYSTSINPPEKERCLQLGAYAYVIKPVSYNEGIETARLFTECCGDRV